MKAVIMAGGEGTRLRPLTCDIPKPLVKLCGRPVSEYILDLLGEHGCEKAVFTLRYLGKKSKSTLTAGNTAVYRWILPMKKYRSERRAVLKARSRELILQLTILS